MSTSARLQIALSSANRRTRTFFTQCGQGFDLVWIGFQIKKLRRETLVVYEFPITFADHEGSTDSPHCMVFREHCPGSIIRRVCKQSQRCSRQICYSSIRRFKNSRRNVQEARWSVAELTALRTLPLRLRQLNWSRTKSYHNLPPLCGHKPMPTGKIF